MGLLVKLTNTTFIRNKGEFVYLYNQVNNNERYYEKESADFINTLSKIPRQVEGAINELMILYDVDRNILEQDYFEFVKDLEKDSFVVSGSTIEELNKKEPVFTYKSWNKVSVNKKEIVNTNENAESNETAISSIIIASNELYVENLYLEITRRCNEHCVHCYIPEEQRRSGAFMPLDDAKNYLDQAKELGVWQISITGGEPFLHPQISEILEYARKKDFIISILSNLSLLKPHHIPLLKKVIPSQIQVSLYSLNAEVHDSITGLVGSFDKTMAALNMCIENDIPVQVNCPIVKQNKNDFTQVLDWAKQYGIKANTDFYIMAQTDYSLKNLENTLPKKDVKKVYSTLLKNDKELRNGIHDSFTKNNNEPLNTEQHICGAGNNTLFISATGKVSPCATWQSFELGDLKHNSLSDIYYNNSAIKKLRNIKYKNYPEVVNSTYRSFIKVCPAHNANTHKGDYKKMPTDVFENAQLQYEASKEFLNIK